MARKSNAQIEAEALAKAEEINGKVEERVQAMLPALMAGLVAELSKVRGDLGPAAAPVTADTQRNDKTLLEGVAHAFMKASDPGNRRRILPPEVLEARDNANKAMIAAILKYHAEGVVPIYQVIRVTFLNETLIHPQEPDPATKAMVDTEIDWAGVPNQSMVPTKFATVGGEKVEHPATKEIHGHYLASIGARAGHYMMGFQKVNGEIEPNSVPIENLDAPIVLTSKGEIRRGHAGAPKGFESSIHDTFIADPRRGNRVGKPRTQNILGTTAPAAVIS